MMNSDPSSSRTRRAPVDALAVGRSIMSAVAGPEQPEVPGYRMVAYAASGGLGDVWEAVRELDGVPAALKLPRSDDPELAERLAVEAETLRSLRHPHIVELLEFTMSSADRPVLVMEWVDGPNLAARLPEAGFDFTDALAIFLPVLEAMEFAHSRGVIHRDLKPSNILLTSAGVPKVSDFGLARSLKDRLVAFTLTKSGAVAGTVEYLAPECYRHGYEPSPAADIYALGVLLYELLTGTPPRGAWRPLSVVKPLDVRLDELLDLAIHPDPAQRLASAGEFRRRLLAIPGTRPRLSGTPLVTPAVRTLDVLWTVFGAYLCAAAFCATLSQSNTPVPRVFDLTFGGTKLMAGFFAIWILSLGIGLMWLWQIVRLWIFRHVPLRESLPSPFGLRLGNTRLAAFLVASGQLLLVLVPILCTLIVVATALRFWTPETPVWQRCLMITPWHSDVPVSPWKWDPLNAVNGGAYWIKDAQGGFTPGTLQVYDKTSFFILTQPFLMSLAAVITGGGLVFTFVMMCRHWIPRRWKTLTGLTVVAGLFLAAAGPSWHREFTLLRRQAKSPAKVKPGHAYWAARLAERHTSKLMEALILHLPDAAPDRALLQSWFPKPCVWMGKPGQSVDQIAAWMAHDGVAAKAENRRLETKSIWTDTHHPRADWTKKFTISHFLFENYRPPDGTYSARMRRLAWKGRVIAGKSMPITAVVEKSTILYSGAAALPVLTAREAEQWLGPFLSALSTPLCPGLEDFFQPSLFKEGSPNLIPRETVAAALRLERARWETLSFTLSESLPVPESRPGARWRIRPVLRSTGLGPGESAGSGFTPTIELVRLEGSLRVVSFAL